MRKNMGAADRTIRISAAVLILILYIAGVISGTAAIVLLIVAGIFILTSFMRFCPLYLPFGISTRRRHK